MQGFSAPGFIRACTHVLIPIFRILFLPRRCPHLNKRHAGGWAPVPATSQHLSLPFWDRSKSDDHVVIGGLWWVTKLKIVVYVVSCQNQRAADPMVPGWGDLSCDSQTVGDQCWEVPELKIPSGPRHRWVFLSRPLWTPLPGAWPSWRNILPSSSDSGMFSARLPLSWLACSPSRVPWHGSHKFSFLPASPQLERVWLSPKAAHPIRALQLLLFIDVALSRQLWYLLWLLSDGHWWKIIIQVKPHSVFSMSKVPNF